MTTLGGKKSRIAFAIEATYGTNPATGYLTIGQIQGEPQVTVNNQLIPIHASGRINTRNILAGQVQVGATIDYYAQDATFLIAAIGDLDTTSPVTNTSNYIHYGTTEDSTSTTATPVEYESKAYSLSVGLENGTTDDVLSLTGCKTNSISVTLSQTEPLKVSADIIAQNVTYETTAQAITEITYGPWMYHDKGTINLDSVTIADMTELTFTVDNGLNRVYGILPTSKKRAITDLLQGDRGISGSITFNYDGSYTELSKLFSDQANAVTPSNDKVKEFTITCLLDNNETTTVADYRAIYIELTGVKLGELTKRIPQDGNAVTEAYNFTATNVDIKGYDATASDPWS